MVTCDNCTGECCKIIVVEIDEPETADDFEDIKWYLYPPGVSVYIGTDGSWNVQFDSTCRNLAKDGRCMIYEQRPPVCRKAEVKDCHRNKPDIKVMFDSVEKYERWLNGL